LTEALRRRLFSKAAELKVDADGFTAWIAGVVPLTSPPGTPFMTAVEAVLFLSRGAFLTLDDLSAAALLTPGDRATKIVGSPVSLMWNDQALKLFSKAGTGQITLYGRKAPRFGADPVGDVVPIPCEFFAEKVKLLFNSVCDPDHPEHAVYYDVKISTTGFTTAFLASDDKAPPNRDSTAKRRSPTRQDAQEFEAWAKGLHVNRGYGPSRGETEKFAAERHLNRAWARDQIAKLPSELRRGRGGSGSTKHQLKARTAD
jgi:hypothetical protein